jgi:AAA+ superfamily predicted ATPase
MENGTYHQNGPLSYSESTKNKGSGENKDLSNALPQNNRTTNYFHTYTKEQLDEAYEQAPPEVKKVLKRLAHPEIKLPDPDIRALFFSGRAGTGKTRTAVMMAYKLRWALSLVRATKLTEKERGGATVNLRNQLDDMIALDKEGKVVPTIGIIDEIEEILQYASDKHYDTASTGRELGGFLEDQVNNNNFFFVATMNDYKTFSESIKSRMKCKFVEFDCLVDKEEKVRAFKKKILTNSIILGPACSDHFLLNSIGELKKCSGRDIRSLVNDVINNCLEDMNSEVTNPLEVRSEHIIKALARLQKDTNRFEKEEESDQQCQERYFKNNLRAQLIMQTRQKSQGSLGGSCSIGKNNGDIGFGGSISFANAPGMSIEDAQKTWEIFYPGEQLIEKPETSSCVIQ